MKLKLLIFFIFFSVQSQTKLPEGFVYVETIIPSIKIDLRYCSTNNFIGKPIDGYNKEVLILSKEATIALKNVQDELQAYNLSVMVYDAYRPQRAVNHFVRWAKDLNDT